MKKKLFMITLVAVIAVNLTACNEKQKMADNVKSAMDELQEMAGEESEEVQGGVASYRNAEVGDIVYFGRYEQDNDFSNGSEEIAWRVLEVEDIPSNSSKLVYIVSENILDYMPYDEEGETIVWEYCSLHKWLNKTFFKSAFTAEEQELIYLSTISILSAKEVEKYFPVNENEKIGSIQYYENCYAELTEYAKAVYESEELLYSSGYWLKDAEVLLLGGRLSLHNKHEYECIGHNLVHLKDGVRPVLELWLR